MPTLNILHNCEGDQEFFKKNKIIFVTAFVITWTKITERSFCDKKRIMSQIWVLRLWRSLWHWWFYEPHSYSEVEAKVSERSSLVNTKIWKNEESNLSTTFIKVTLVLMSLCTPFIFWSRGKSHRKVILISHLDKNLSGVVKGGRARWHLPLSRVNRVMGARGSKSPPPLKCERGGREWRRPPDNFLINWREGAVI